MSPTRRPREPNIPADLEPSDVAELDDDVHLDEVAIGAGPDPVGPAVDDPQVGGGQLGRDGRLARAHGAGGLRNVVIGRDQVLDLALPALAALGIRVEDPEDDG